MIGKWIRKTTRALWPVAPMRVMFWLTICLLVGAIAPAAAVALGSYGVAQAAGTTAATGRYAAARWAVGQTLRGRGIGGYRDARSHRSSDEVHA
jgi:hypothetical protein